MSSPADTAGSAPAPAPAVLAAVTAPAPASDHRAPAQPTADPPVAAPTTAAETAPTEASLARASNFEAGDAAAGASASQPVAAPGPTAPADGTLGSSEAHEESAKSQKTSTSASKPASEGTSTLHVRGAPTNSEASKDAVPPNAPAAKATRPKRGFMAKLKGVLLSCVGPSPAHPIGDDVVPTRAATPAASTPPATTQPVSSAPAEKAAEPAAPVAAPEDVAPADAPVSLEAAVEVVTDPAAPAPAITAADVTPAPDATEDVVVPPEHTPHLLPEDVTAGLTSGAVVAPGASGHQTPHVDHSRSTSVTGTGTPGTGTGVHDESGNESEDTNVTDDDMPVHEPEEEDDEARLIAQGGVGIPFGPDGVPCPLLPPIAPHHAGRKCLVLDLDETLVHSLFKVVPQADYVVPIEIQYRWHNVYVLKRPGVDAFLKKMGEIYEIVVYTASLSMYADPVLDKLDIHHVISHRLFRESCYNHRGTSYVKDLSQLGRPVEDMIILDNSPASYIFHPNNAVPVSSWFNDPHDTELTDLCPFLVDLAQVDDVRGVLDGAL